MKIAVTGATGFVGTHICRQLLRDSHQVTGLSRSAEDILPGIEHIKGDVTTGKGLTEAFSGVDAVIHLVGIIRESGAATFEDVHVTGTQNVISAMETAGVRRLIHMSALGAESGANSSYQSTKAQAEQKVRNSDMAWTIMRPSLIFGIGDDFFGDTLRNLVRQPPIVPVVGSGDYPFSPVSIEDVAIAFSRALERPETIGQSYDLVGPREYTLRELLLLVRKELGLKKPLVNVPLPFMHLGTWLFKILPNPPITRDELLMLLSGNTGSTEPAQSAFDLELTPLESNLGEILAKAAD